jgi:SHS2 domain-containing protein
MTNAEKQFEILEHPADVGFLAYGQTLEELFENAALAMCSLACSADRIEERVERGIEARSSDIESLLYAWLAEILAVADAEQLVFRRVRVTTLSAPRGIGDRSEAVAGEVRGIAYGEAFDRQQHAAGTYIKAVTLHQFSVEQGAEGWRARVFLDL